MAWTKEQRNAYVRGWHARNKDWVFARRLARKELLLKKRLRMNERKRELYLINRDSILARIRARRQFLKLL